MPSISHTLQIFFYHTSKAKFFIPILPHQYKVPPAKSALFTPFPWSRYHRSQLLMMTVARSKRRLLTNKVFTSIKMWNSHNFFIIMAVVNYQTLNIGELLHLLPCDILRSNVRLIKILNKRFINAKYGKIFNETCISERLFPKLAYIYIYEPVNVIRLHITKTLWYRIIRLIHNSFIELYLLLLNKLMSIRVHITKTFGYIIVRLSHNSFIRFYLLLLN